MKAFLAIAAFAVLLFIVAGVAEERETFARNWFERPAVSRGSDADRRDAANAVYLFRTLSSHLYASGGDARFGERLPASKAIVDELRADVDYLRRNNRIETPRLVRIEFLGSDVAGDSAEVRTREYWVTEIHWPDGSPAEPARSDLEFGRYRLTRDGSRWVVGAWDPVDAPQESPR